MSDMEGIKRELSGLSILSFILGIIPYPLPVLIFVSPYFAASWDVVFIVFVFVISVGSISAILAIVLGNIALKKIEKKADILKGKGWAIAGIILGGLWLFLDFVLITW